MRNSTLGERQDLRSIFAKNVHISIQCIGMKCGVKMCAEFVQDVMLCALGRCSAQKWCRISYEYKLLITETERHVKSRFCVCGHFDSFANAIHRQVECNLEPFCLGIMC